MFNVDAQKAPFFIVGCSRSGTTLLQALIDGQPHIAIPPESHIYARFDSIFHTYGDLGARPNRLRLIEDLLRDAFIRRWRLDVTAPDLERRIPRKTVGGVIEALFGLYAEMHGANRWGDKTPGHIHHLPAIRRDFPAATLIHLIRDGRDVAEARRRMIWGPVSAPGLAQEWYRDVTQWQAFCNHAGTAGTVLVRYEDLVTSPGPTLEKILRLMGEPFTDTVSSFSDTALSRTLVAEGPWHSSLGQRIGTGKIGIYRQKLTPRDIEIFESIAGGALVAYGYEIDSRSPRPPVLYDRLRAFAVDRVVRWYRKLHHPRVFWVHLQPRLRTAYRRLIGNTAK